MNKYRSSLECL